MAFSSKIDRHSFPHRFPTGYGNMTFGPKEIGQSHLEGSILVSDVSNGPNDTRRKRAEVRTFTFTYPVLTTEEWKELWDFYNIKAEHELHYFYINLYYMDHEYDDEWIGVNFRQKFTLKNFETILGEIGLILDENIQATATRGDPNSSSCSSSCSSSFSSSCSSSCSSSYSSSSCSSSSS